MRHPLSWISVMKDHVVPRQWLGLGSTVGRLAVIGLILSLAACMADDKASASKNNHVIVNFSELLTRDLVTGLSLSGVRVLGRRADGEYYVFLPDPMAPTSDGVQSELGAALQLDWRIPSYEEKVTRSLRSRRGGMELLVQVYPDVSRADLLERLIRVCPAPECFAVPYGPRSWKVSASDELLPSLAALDIVKRIEPATQVIRLLNSVVRDVVFTTNAHTDPGNKGAGVKAGVADTGIYRDHADFQPQDKKFYVSRTSFVDRHATLVASVLASKEGSYDSTLFGHAPAAQLGNYPTISADYQATRQALVDDGSQVTNHSYTLTSQPGYSIEVSEVDALIRGGVTGAGLQSIPAVPQVWAGGGAGPKGRASNEGKNMIVVSSVDALTCGDARTACVEPYDPVASLTLDGRIKPDIVAPGCRKSPDDGVQGAAATGVTDYRDSCASSYAAPVVSGAIALMIETLNDRGLNGFTSPASYRAAIVQTAIDQLGPSTGDAKGHLPGPDVPSGWGLLNVMGAVSLVQEADRIREGMSVASIGQTDTYCMTAPSDAAVRVTLAWDDLPGESCGESQQQTSNSCSSTTSKLVQDLDLRLRRPVDGLVAHPWSLTLDPSGAISQSQSSADRANNIEVVDAGPMVNASEPSVDWILEVSAYQLIEPQTYSLAASHDFAPCQPEQPEPVTTPRPPEVTRVIIPEPDPFGSLVIPASVSRICSNLFGCEPCAGSESGSCAAFALEITGLPEDARLILFDGSGREARADVTQEGDARVLRIPTRPVDSDYYLMVTYGAIKPGMERFRPLHYRIPGPRISNETDGRRPVRRED